MPTSKDIQINLRTLIVGIISVVLLTLGLVFAFNFGKRDALQQYRETFTAYQDTVVKPALRTSDSLKHLSDSVILVARQAEKTSDSLSTNLVSLQNTNRSLRNTNGKLSDSLKNLNLPPECDVCKSLVANLESEVVALNSTISSLEKRDTSRIVELQSWKTGFDFQRTRADSLQTVIVNWPIPPKPRNIFGIELSDRIIFIAGIVVGAVAVKSVP